MDFLHKKNLSATEKQQIHTDLLASNRDDAMILLDGKEENGALYFNMLVLGHDGLLGEFCGNGSRAVAAYLYLRYATATRFFIKSLTQNYELLMYENGIFGTKLPPVTFMPNSHFIRGENLFSNSQRVNQLAYLNKTFYYAALSEPHLLLPEKISLDDLNVLGRQLNADGRCFPFGMNITAFIEEKPNLLCAVTYERGVQRLTQSCGTGASCAAAFYLNNRPGQVMVKNPGGILEIIITPDYLELKGPATIENN